MNHLIHISSTSPNTDQNWLFHCHRCVRPAILRQLSIPSLISTWPSSVVKNPLAFKESMTLLNLILPFFVSINGSRPGKLRCFCDPTFIGRLLSWCWNSCTRAVLVCRTRKVQYDSGRIYFGPFGLLNWAGGIPPSIFLYLILIFFLCFGYWVASLKYFLRGQAGILWEV